MFSVFVRACVRESEQKLLARYLENLLTKFD